MTDQRPHPRPLALHWVDSPHAFAALHDQWNALAARSRYRSVFLRHEWFDAAWQWAGAASQLRLLCAYSDDQLVGLLPLVLQSVPWGRGSARTLSFLTVPDTQLCDAVAVKGLEDEVASVFVERLWAERGTWDVLRLGYLPSESMTAGPICSGLQAKGLRAVTREAGGNPYIALDTTWEAYYATRSRSLKKANNLAANRIKKAGRVTIERLSRGSGSNREIERVLSLITDISSRSWKSRTGNSLENPGPQAFIRRLSELVHKRGFLSVWLLSLDDVPLAMEYQLIAYGDVFALRSDFDASREEISPGSHLSRVLLEQLFAECKGRYYMGPGENAYKYRWTEQITPVFELTVYSTSLAGRMLAAWELELKPLARSVRDRLKPSRPPKERFEKAEE